MENEIWVDIPGWENYYMISNLQRVRSLYREITFTKLSGQTVTQSYPETIIQSYGKKYRQVNFWFDRKLHHYYIHRLMGLAFIPNPYNKPYINHINGDKMDNRIDNLEWATASENIQHSYDFLTRKKTYFSGPDHHASKPILQYDSNGDVVNEWINISSVDKKYGSRSSIISCLKERRKSVKGYSWKYKAL